jgi:NAD(P)-dependent dehydrogenase (short-subunit alcohol dehydrogenase family)
MSVKSDISNDYLAALHKQHGAKVPRVAPSIVMTGASRPESIGDYIRMRLEPIAFSTTLYNKDVRDEIRDDWRVMDTLIMCHGVTHLNWFEDCTLEKAKEIFDVNLFGCFNVARNFVRCTINSPHRKRIIAIGSMAHRAVLNGSAAYCASKAGLAHLTRCLAFELAPKGFDVYCIHPSNTRGTPMTKETIEGLARYRKMSIEDATRYWSDSPLREAILDPADIADLVYYILTHKTGYLSGSQIELAGGMR